MGSKFGFGGWTWVQSSSLSHLKWFEVRYIWVRSNANSSKFPSILPSKYYNILTFFLYLFFPDFAIKALEDESNNVNNKGRKAVFPLRTSVSLPPRFSLFVNQNYYYNRSRLSTVSWKNSSKKYNLGKSSIWNESLENIFRLVYDRH